MQKINELKVFYKSRQVGTMAAYKNYLAAFEYTTEWLAEGFSISPYSLPLQKRFLSLKLLHSKNFSFLYDEEQKIGNCRQLMI